MGRSDNASHGCVHLLYDIINTIDFGINDIIIIIYSRRLRGYARVLSMGFVGFVAILSRLLWTKSEDRAEARRAIDNNRSGLNKTQRYANLLSLVCAYRPALAMTSRFE